ncbi:MAG: response regulator transcription factor [Chloroflexota bacterium]|nr:response regulator transcription factor [Chloroflexota bacterium]
MISTILADDHPIVRQGLRALLETADGCTIIGEASDGLTAIRLIEDHSPQIAILDVQLPDLNGLEVARRVRTISPDTRVIMLSMFSDEPFVLEALRNGAMGYVLKGSATEELVDAVNAVLAGRRYLSQVLNDRAVEAYARGSDQVKEPVDSYQQLTSREREVLQLSAQGLSNAEIGERLSISSRTAETHRTNILRKLKLQSQSDLVRYVLNRGLLTP